MIKGGGKVSNLGGWPTPPDRHAQGIHDQFPGHPVTQGPTYDLTGKKIQDHRQIQPAFMGPDVSDVRNIHPVRSLHCELPVQ